MDLDLTADQEAFRAEVRAWLEANVPVEPLGSTHDPHGFAAHRAWERTLYDAGYAAIHWPRKYGGRDADLPAQAIFSEEYARAGAPARINVLALGMAGPTVMAFGTPEQQQRWLPGMLSCEAIWSQGFSEPDAGSDLAGVRTFAARDGDRFIVNGQKIWTSLGRFADWAFTLVRTDRDAARHAGLTFLMINLRSPGVEVRPIVQINSDAGFAEVFFTDVEVPVANVVGAVNDGWRVAMATLGFERGTGLGSHVRFSQTLDELVRLVKAMGLESDPVVRDQVARLFTQTEVFRHNTNRTLTRLASGRQLGPEASLNKLYWSEMSARLYEVGLDVLGPYGELAPSAAVAVDRDGWVNRYWYARASTIYAGTSEIQKNIIAERVLGLPREPSGRA